MIRLATSTALALALLFAGADPARGATDWVWPLRGEVITPYRNGGDPYAAGQHRGIDIAGPVGAPVVAAAGGVVRFAGSAGYSGLTVSVRTADGRYDTSYLHLSSISVREGRHVVAGERLGAVGTTGRGSAARPHLHFGVRDAGSRHDYHDPLDFLPPPARPRPAPRRPPVPVGVPVRPSPVSRVHGAPVRIRLPEPRPAPEPTPRSLPVRSPLPRPALRPVPGLRPVTGLRPTPVPRGRRAAARRGAPEVGPASVPAPAPHPAPSPPPVRRPSRGASGAGGPDLGWALACLGLLLAAGLMGARGDPGRSRRALPARLGGLLRPLAGRG